MRRLRLHLAQLALQGRNLSVDIVNGPIDWIAVFPKSHGHLVR
jgi:hypothetical protein